MFSKVENQRSRREFTYFYEVRQIGSINDMRTVKIKLYESITNNNLYLLK